MTSTGGGRTGRCVCVRAVLGSDRTAIDAAAAENARHGGRGACGHRGHRRLALVNSHETLRAIGNRKLRRIWDDPESRAVRFQRLEAPRLLAADASRIETAARASRNTSCSTPAIGGIAKTCGPFPGWIEMISKSGWSSRSTSTAASWRPGPDSPDHWRRAVEILGHVGGGASVPAFAGLRASAARQAGNGRGHFVPCHGWPARREGVFVG